MRTTQKGGLCALCGTESDDGLYWRTYACALDFGIDSIPPADPDMSVPVLCDNCETLHRVCQAYNHDPIDAQRIYFATSARDALRLLGWRPSPALANRFVTLRRKEKDDGRRYLSTETAAGPNATRRSETWR